MNNKKGLIIEALIRTVIAVILVVVVLNIGKNAGEAAGLWGVSQSAKSFGNLADKLNFPDLKDGDSRQELISMDKGTAIIGFSKGYDYECYGCGGDPKDKLTAKFHRPQNTECKDSSCLCLCLEGLPKIRGGQQILDITCGKLQCRKLDTHIVTKVELGELIEKKYGSGHSKFSSWQGGFLIARDTGEVDAAISGLPKSQQNTITLTIEKRSVSGILFIGVCPGLPCIKAELLTTTSNIKS